MFDLGLGGSLSTYLAGLIVSHPVRFTVELYDEDDAFLSDLTANTNIWVSGGTVNVDAEQDVTRSLQLDLIDPDGLTIYDEGAVTNTMLHMSRSLRAYRGDFVTGIGWVDCPVFHGPITKVDGDGIQVKVEALGKESLFQPPNMHWKTGTLYEGMLFSECIERLFAERGEVVVLTATTDDWLKHPMGYLGTENTWDIVSYLARELDMLSFFDGEGTYTLRDYSTTPVYTFSYGSNMLSVPNKPIDYTTVRNTVQNLGSRPDGGGRRRSATVFALPSHPLSPESLARNGVNRYLVENVESDHQKKKATLRNKALRILDQGLAQVSEISFDAFPVPPLQEYDVVTVNDQAGESYTMVMKKWTIPLFTSGVMTVGSNRRVDTSHRHTPRAQNRRQFGRRRIRGREVIRK